ncbi:MAG TPA: hypothetical protein VE996_04750 [Terriglobales bacterium]|nr:hypothetical protein [Terriglobales bacterium]
MKRFLSPLFLAATALAIALPIWAVSTVFWRTATYTAFSRGTLTSLSIAQDGTLSLAPALREVFDSGQALIWTVAADPAGNVYVGTGHRGRIYRLTPAMLAGTTPAAPAQALFFTAPEPEIFALAVGPDGALYAGTSPNGKVYRIAENGASSVYFDPKTPYIWSLLFQGSTLFVGTGDRGEIYSVTGPGQGKPFYATEQQQVMALAADHEGNLLAGTDPDGLIFRITPAGKGFVLFNSPLQEIHRLAVAADGSIYATGQGQAVRRLPNAVVAGEENEFGPAPRPTVTVVAETANRDDTAGSSPAQAGTEAQAQQPAPNGPNGSVTVSAGRAVPRGGATPLFRPPLAPRGVRSALYRIAPDDSVETVWSSNDEDADDVLPAAGGLLFSTDSKGRIYRLGPDRLSTLLVQTNQEETTRLLRVGDYTFATTGNFGNLYRLSAQPAERGSFVSEVRDAHSIAHWGDLSWQARVPAGSRLAFYTRSGNSEHPDATWSDWSPALAASGSRISSPAARFLQWKAEFTAAPSGASPVLEEVTVPYLPSNQAPEITNIEARTAMNEGESEPGPNVVGAINYITNARGELEAAPLPGARGKQGEGIALSWQAHDPDRDALTYDVYFQAQGESGWTLLRRNLRAPHLEVTGALLPDGTYKFKVVASDADANPPALAKTAEIISAPATLDTTPPAVTVAASAQTGPGAAEARFAARDASSALTRAEYSIDAGPWHLMLSDDGIIDSPAESFTVHAGELKPGQHLLMLRVWDSAGNRGSAQALVTIR